MKSLAFNSTSGKNLFMPNVRIEILRLIHSFPRNYFINEIEIACSNKYDKMIAVFMQD